MAEQSGHHRVGQASARIEALSDGVFAIAMTILVFDLQPSDGALGPALWALRHKLVVFAISFALLGIYWSGLRGQFHYVRRADHNLHWLNILLFAFVSLVPFSAKVLGREPRALLAQAVYAANLIAIGLILYWHLRYAVRHGLADDAPASVRRGAALRCLVAPACYLVALGVGLLDTRVSLGLFAVVPALYVVPQLQGLWWRAAQPPM